MSRALVFLALWFAPALAFAQDAGAAVAAEESARVAEAKKVLTQYLSAVKGKKWADAKKLTHPSTLKVIEERKRRLKQEDHGMSPWGQLNVHYLREFRITGAREAEQGTVVVETSEDHYQVEEKGVVEDEMAAYLLGKKGGKWLVVDKKRQQTFAPGSIRLGYKDYFDPVGDAAP